MTWQLTPFAILFFISSILILGVIVFAFRHIHVRGARYFIFLGLSVEIWTLFMGLEYAAVQPALKILFGKVEYLGIATIGATWLMFALSYNYREKWLTRRNMTLLLALPAATLLLVFTNEAHGLLWPKITPASDAPGASLIYVHGPAFWVIFIFDYITLAIGTFFIINSALRSHDIHRWQMLGLIASGIIPWIGNLVYVSGLSPIPGLDLTPLGFVLSALVVAVSIFYLGLFDLVPVARDQLVESLMDGVLVLDNQNRLADLNPRARELLGIGTERVVGRRAADFLQPWADLVERFRDIESAQTEIHIGDEEITDIELRISPLVDEHGYLIGRLIVVRDISERKKLEKVRDDLIRAMVHDLRNPLASVGLSMDLLRTQLISSLTREQLLTFETGEQSVQQILRLVNSILDISRLESGEMPLKREQVSLQKLAVEAINTQILIAKKKRVLLQENVPAGLPPVWIDPELMQRVFQNLLDNAVKFSVDGGVVQIRAGYDPGMREIVVSVTDTGPGIPKEIRSRIFEKFVTGHDKGSGSGLGLAFCRLVMEAHGGRIWLEDQSTDSTIFSVSIPLS